MSASNNSNDFQKDKSILQLDFEFLLGELRQRVKELESSLKLMPRMDDGFLSKFLRTRNGDLDKALKSLENYYNSIWINMDFLSGVSTTELESTFNSNIICFLRHRSNGQRVCLSRSRLWKPTEHSFRQMHLVGLFQAEFVSEEPLTQENGISVIVDSSGVSFTHIRHLNLRELKRISNFLMVNRLI